jgi:hypothetical protein
MRILQSYLCDAPERRRLAADGAGPGAGTLPDAPMMPKRPNGGGTPSLHPSRAAHKKRPLACQRPKSREETPKEGGGNA